MKPLLILILVILFFGSCTRRIEEDLCSPANPVCADVVPTNELCAAFFTRWFYDKTTNSCKQVGYSGCNAKGFATQEECESCKCR